MGFEYLTNIPLAKAKEDYLNLLESHGFGSKTEMIPVWDACGRVTAKRRRNGRAGYLFGK